MRWLGQILQAIVFILLVGGLMFYVADRTEPQDASQPCPNCREFWDPNHLIVATSDQIPLRRRELARDFGVDPSFKFGTLTK